jgi:hypothetical protein
VAGDALHDRPGPDHADPGGAEVQEACGIRAKYNIGRGNFIACSFESIDAIIIKLVDISGGYQSILS